MDAAPFVEIGRVAKTHGLDGEVSVVMTVDLPVSRLVGVEVWFVPPHERLRSARVESVRSGPKGPLVSFEGVPDIGAAELLRGRTVLARAEDLPEVADELDLLGFRVIDEARGDLGEVVDVIITGANDVLVVQGAFGEVLIPDIEACVFGVDESDRSISVRLLPGLLDED